MSNTHHRLRSLAPVDLRPFSIDVDESVLVDLRTRLERTRWPTTSSGAVVELLEGFDLVIPSLPGYGFSERAYIAAVAEWDSRERGYSPIQGTRPQTLAHGLTDSPAALVAWVVEKWRLWADTDGDLDARFNRDDLLTLVTLYWVTSTIGTSIRDYFDNRLHGTATLPPNARVSVPTGIANFHHSRAHEGIVPREWAKRIYNVTRFTDTPSGGHFAPTEEPGLLAEEITAFFS